MNRLQLRPVAIAGANGQRSSMFAGGINDVFGARMRPAYGLSSRSLGQTTDQEWYEKAKGEIAKFDDLSTRAKKIANKAVREQIWATHVGDVADHDSGAYRRLSVSENIAEAESYTPVNYLFFGPGKTARERVEDLSDVNHDFRVAVQEAEASWGTLPEPQIIERIVEVPGAPAAEEGLPVSKIFTVAAVGGIAVIGLALLGVFD
jgi:hypothetical protein